MYVCVYVYTCTSIIECISCCTVCRLPHLLLLKVTVRFAFKGGAPNYYPNSFSAPEQQPRFALESSTHFSGDVRRYNSANDDNVSQVTAPSSAVAWPMPPSTHSGRTPLIISLYRAAWGSGHSALPVRGLPPFSSPKCR